MTPKQERAEITLREIAAGQKALRRHANVAYMEQLSKQNTVRIEHSMHDFVIVTVQEETERVSSGAYIRGQRSPSPSKVQYRTLVTLIDPGKDFPSDTLV